MKEHGFDAILALLLLLQVRRVLDGIISRASGCRHRINTSVFNVSSVPRIGARSIGASLKGRIRPSHSNIISMEAVMAPAGVPTGGQVKEVLA